MSPIPANASMAMLFSFFAAVIITPWLLFHISHLYYAGFESEGAESTVTGARGGSISPWRGRS
jgi:hypothetical protein